MKIKFVRKVINPTSMEVAVPLGFDNAIVNQTEISKAKKYFTRLRDEQDNAERAAEFNHARAVLETASIFGATLKKMNYQNGNLTFVFDFNDSFQLREFKFNMAEMISTAMME